MRRHAALLALVCLPCSVYAAEALRLRAHATTRGDVVRLGDVLAAPPPGWAELVVAPAPDVGRALLVTPDDVTRALEVAGLNGAGVALVGTGCHVEPEVVTLDAAALLAEARAAAARALGVDGAAGLEPCAPSPPPDGLAVPLGRCRTALTASVLAGGPGEVLLVEVRAEVDGRVRGRVTLGLRASGPAAAPGGATSTPRRAMAAPPRVTATEPAPAVVVRRGERVRVEARAGALLVTTEGVIATEGALGAEVSVQLRHGAVVRGRVAAPTLVLIEAAERAP